MNTQINEDYVSFEIAKLLKEKEFDENCFALYNPSEELIQCGVRLNNTQVGRVEGSYSAPTLQMAMKWLRGLYWLNMYPKYNKWSNKWSIVILSLDDREVIKGNTSIQMDGFISYEEAVNEGIKYCLTNLI